MNSIYQVLLNVLGGAITVGLIELWRLLNRTLAKRAFRRIFGEDIFSPMSFHLVYGEMELRPLQLPNGEVTKHPYQKPGEEASGKVFSIDRPVSSCEVRSAKYLATMIGLEARVGPSLSSDLYLKDRLDLSFIAFGGPGSNFKSRDAINNQQNDMIKFDGSNLMSVKTGRALVNLEDGFDYGLILKIHPTQFQNRIWLVCAGRGEWGSSGAAWFIARKWREIEKLAGNSQFSIVVRVRNEQDEYAEPIQRLKNSAEAEIAADKVKSIRSGL